MIQGKQAGKKEKEKQVFFTLPVLHKIYLPGNLSKMSGVINIKKDGWIYYQNI